MIDRATGQTVLRIKALMQTVIEYKKLLMTAYSISVKVIEEDNFITITLSDYLGERVNTRCYDYKQVMYYLIGIYEGIKYFSTEN